MLVADPVRADVAATVLMIDGLRDHRALARSLGIEQYLLIAEPRQLLASPAIARNLEAADHWEIEIIN